MTRPLRGKIASPVRLIEVLPLAQEDLEVLHAPRARTIAQRFREPHHLVARLLATGMDQMEVARTVGYSVTRISQLEADPAFKQLLAVYRERITAKIEEKLDEFLNLATHNMVRAERTIADHFDQAEEEGELIPLKTALLIRADSADRFGYGKRQMNLNVNVDFAANLEKARQRSARVLGKEGGSAPSSLPPAPSEPSSSPDAPALEVSYRRLA